MLHEGDRIAINGSTGEVTIDDVDLVDAQIDPNFETVLGWADELRTLGVRANADVPADARRARAFGAEGIGLCRTEHMFMAADRQPKMRAMIMAAEEPERRAALDELLPLQQQDFEGLFEAMEGLPVTIRLLDPPLHEFLPGELDLLDELRDAREHRPADVAELSRTLKRVQELSETNPMLGTRGCRLGILYPEIYEMQVSAIMRAVRAVRERSGRAPHTEVMIPLVNYERELTLMRDLVVRIAEQEGMRDGVDYTVGTMIELPRACVVADHLAEHADFFSFGTNDLTQTALGFSRDDIERKILARYINEHIVGCSPFETIDRDGVGVFVRWPSPKGAPAIPTSNLGCAASMAATPSRSNSLPRRASTTCPAHRSGCRSPESPPPRPRPGRELRTRQVERVGTCCAPRAAPRGPARHRRPPPSGFPPTRSESRHPARDASAAELRTLRRRDRRL